MEAALMTAQIERLNAERGKMNAETERFRQEMKWEPYKALAAIVGGILGASAVMVTAVLALASWLSFHPHLLG
jgi:hypothetical protein